MISQNINEYTQEIVCIYKNETYSVRDNGAIIRHSKHNGKKRKNDNIWTFGTADKKSGYLLIAGVRVHRIVATAFHGEAPSKEYIVDHKNTNKQDNRPTNLRWVTKLENIILNPITCKKIMYLTGKSIDYVLQHIDILHNLNNLPQNISWMRNVTAQESKNCYDNLLHWAEEDTISPTKKRGAIGEWIYQKRFFSDTNKDNHLIYTKTENAVHDRRKMKLPSEYPCCPNGEHEHTLEEYLANLKPGAPFFETKYSHSLVSDAVIHNNKLIVRTKSKVETIKPYHVVIITLVNNTYVHDLYRSCFHEDSSLKYFTELQGLEWAGGQVFDDLC
ncbi:MAG: HNH endonuclease [Treponema sp.]|nr:HNH endonuclease [Treponema sp.]